MHKELLNRIEMRLKEMGISHRKASLNAGLSADAIRNIRRMVENETNSDRKGVSTHTIYSLAKSLETTPQWLLFGAESEYDEWVESQFQVSPELLKKADDLANREILKFKLEDEGDRAPYFKFLAYYIEQLRRESKNGPL